LSESDPSGDAGESAGCTLKGEPCDGSLVRPTRNRVGLLSATPCASSGCSGGEAPPPAVGRESGPALINREKRDVGAFKSGDAKAEPDGVAACARVGVTPGDTEGSKPAVCGEFGACNVIGRTLPRGPLLGSCGTSGAGRGTGTRALFSGSAVSGGGLETLSLTSGPVVACSRAAF
jgi:hypothetical protein